MEDKGLMIRCTRCGEMNRLPAVHCKRCGTKLDFESAEKAVIRGGQATFMRQFRKAVRYGLLGALLLVILLMIWPGKMTRRFGDEMDAKRYRMKGELLIDALNRGMPAVQVIGEEEINSHLRERVAAQPAPKGRFSPVIADVGARFSAGRAEGFIAVRRGPLTFTGHFYAKPQNNKLVVTGAAAGHLPLPGILGRLYAGTTRGVFRQMKNEVRILRNLDGVAVGDGSIELLIRGGN